MEVSTQILTWLISIKALTQNEILISRSKGFNQIKAEPLRQFFSGARIAIILRSFVMLLIIGNRHRNKHRRNNQQQIQILGNPFPPHQQN